MDKLRYPTIVSIVGNAALAVGLSFVAPASFVSISPSLVTSQAMMAVIGFGQASVMASTFGRSQRAAAKQGFRQDITTYLLISGKNSTVVNLPLYSESAIFLCATIALCRNVVVSALFWSVYWANFGRSNHGQTGFQDHNYDIFWSGHILLYH